jgi:hypothetical protein
MNKKKIAIITTALTLSLLGNIPAKAANSPLNINNVKAALSSAEAAVAKYKCNDTKAGNLWQKLVDAALKPSGYSLEKVATLPAAKYKDFALKFQAAAATATPVIVADAKAGCKGIK